MATARSTPNSIQQPYSFLLFALNEKRFSLRFFFLLFYQHTLMGLTLPFTRKPSRQKEKKSYRSVKYFPKSSNNVAKYLLHERARGKFLTQTFNAIVCD